MRLLALLISMIVLVAPLAVLADDGATQITTHPALDRGPSWSPDGSQMAINSNRGSGGGGRIWVIPATGGGATQITFDNYLHLTSAPDWSPNASHIVFARGHRNYIRESVPIEGGNPGQFRSKRHVESYSISVVPATGGTPTQIALGALPAWSPDNNQIAFASGSSGNADIWVIPATGGTATQITFDPGHDSFPDWFGNHIVFSSNRNGSYDLWVIPDTGGPATQITFGMGAHHPCWSPDGLQIAFDAAGADGWSEIWVVPATGGTPARITDDPLHAADPAWSPDGSLIAFNSHRSGSTDIWTIPAPTASRPLLLDNKSWGSIKAGYRD